MESYSICPLGSASSYSAVCKYVETYIYLFGCSGSSLCLRAFCSWGDRGLLSSLVCGLLIAVVSLVADLRPQSTWASVVVVGGLSSCGEQT